MPRQPSPPPLSFPSGARQAARGSRVRPLSFRRPRGLGVLGPQPELGHPLGELGGGDPLQQLGDGAAEFLR